MLKEKMFRLHTTRKFFAVMLVAHWNRLFRAVVDALSLVVFKARLVEALRNLV